MRARPTPRDFGTGELAPQLDGITNEVTVRGLRTAENWIVRKTGSIVRRPGTFFVREVKDSNDSTILVPVEIDTTNSFVLELGDAYIRFYQQSTHAVIGAPYEVTSPWSTGELSSLRWQYIPDEQAIYWTHPLHAMRKLAFTSAASWTMTTAHTDAFKMAVLITEQGLVYRTDNFDDWEVDAINVATTAGGKYFRSQGAVSSKHGIILVADHTNNDIYASEDGVSWFRTGPSDGQPRTVGIDPRGIVVAGGDGTNGIWMSEDGGLSWDQQTAPTSSTTEWWSFAYDESAGYWRATRDTQCAYSMDGRAWSSCAGPYDLLSNPDMDMAVRNSLWVAVGGNGIATSGSVTDTWTTRLTLSDKSLVSVAYGEPNGTLLWVAVRRGGGLVTLAKASSGTIYTAPTSATVWSATLVVTPSPYAVSWVHTRFYVFGAGQQFYRSYDGSAWTTLTESSFQANTDDPVRWVALYEAPDAEWFDATDHYPSDITFYEQRAIIGPTRAEPSTLWGSKTGRFSNFYLGDLANEGWSYKFTGDRNVDIQWIMGGTELVIGTRTEEIVLRGEQGIGITPNGVQALKQSTFGSANIKPVRIHETIVFVQRGGEVIRGYIPAAGTGAWQSPDLTYNAGHITAGGVTQLAHQDDPFAILYVVRADGELLTLTYHPPNVVAWTRIVTDGTFESVAVVPTSGAEDEVWAIVNRTVNGATKRFVEYFSTLNVASQTSAHYVDCGVSVTEGATFVTMGGLTHLATETVDVLVDGNEWLSGLTVAASGTIVFTAGYSGTTAHAGLPYTSKLQTMRSDYGSGYGSGAGLNRKTNNVLLWVHNSLGGFMGPTESLTTEAVLPLSSTADLTIDVVSVNFPGRYDRDNYHWIIVTQPTPFEVVGMLVDVEAGDR